MLCSLFSLLFSAFSFFPSLLLFPLLSFLFPSITTQNTASRPHWLTASRDISLTSTCEASSSVGIFGGCASLPFGYSNRLPSFLSALSPSSLSLISPPTAQWSQMSVDNLTDLFSSATKLVHVEKGDLCLDEIIRKKLAEVASSIPEWRGSGCLLADIGDFLVRASIIFSGLADAVVHGQHIDTHTELKIQEMEEDHDFSELSYLDYLNAKHLALKCVPIGFSLLYSPAAISPI